MPAADATRTERPARWRSPAGWPLRTRLVAIMIALLSVLGLVVGGTAELYLYQSLHNQIDKELDDLSRRFGAPKPPMAEWPTATTPSGQPVDRIPGGIPDDALVLQRTADGALAGGVITFKDAEAMRAYDQHPMHQLAINGVLKELVERVVIYDFVNQ